MAPAARTNLSNAKRAWRDALRNGDASLQRRRFSDAVESYHRALRIQPHPVAYNNLGNAYRALGRRDEAEQAYRNSLKCDPDFVPALGNLGQLAQERGDPAAALDLYERALRVRPSAAIHTSIGNARVSLGRLDDAVPAFRAAIGIEPSAAACTNLGMTFARLGQPDDAEEAYRQSLAIDPDFDLARFGLVVCQLPVVYRHQDEVEKRRVRYARHLTEAAAYYAAATSEARAGAATAVGTTQPFYLACQGLNDRDLQGQYGRMVTDLMACGYPQWTAPPPLSAPDPGERIRVGFVSTYFRDHSVWNIPLRGWLTRLDRRKFGLFGYHTGSAQDADTETAASLCDRFVQGQRTTAQWCREIVRDRPHVLIFPEIGMDPATARIAALRLAPVQAASWGHPTTSGLPTIDYFLSSDLMEPANAEDAYTERLVRLPNIGAYYVPADVGPARRRRSDIGLSQKEVMFWCCQSLHKYLPQHDDVFPRIAGQLETARFVFIEYAHGEMVTGVVRSRLCDAFARHGLNADEYCVFLPRMDGPTFAGTAAMADVFLDSIGWSGANSALGAIAYDVPVVTWPGETMRSRHSCSFLRMMGISETIAATKEEYVTLAVRMGRDPPWRKSLSLRISENKQRLYRDESTVRALEDFLTGAVQRMTSQPV